MFVDLTEQPWKVLTLSVEDFLTGMSEAGPTPEMSMVGAFAADPNDKTVRTAHRDIDLPLHRDGIYTEAIAAMQGGMYIEKPNVDLVGMYCVRDNDAPCYTILATENDESTIFERVDLRAGQALVWDNRLWHGRQGAVGKRLLIRFWTTCEEVRSIER